MSTRGREGGKKTNEPPRGRRGRTPPAKPSRTGSKTSPSSSEVGKSDKATTPALSKTDGSTKNREWWERDEGEDEEYEELVRRGEEKIAKRLQEQGLGSLVRKPRPRRPGRHGVDDLELELSDWELEEIKEIASNAKAPLKKKETKSNKR